MPGHDPAAKQVDAAEQQCQSRYLAQRPAAEAQQHVSVRIQTVRQIGRRLTASASASFTSPSSVGPDTASTLISALISTGDRSSGQRVDSGRSHITGHLSGKRPISRKTRPTSAGLNGFLPNPPNDIFPTPTATESADQHDPDRKRAGQVESEQQARHDGRGRRRW